MQDHAAFLAAAFGPFVQEDAAVFAAAATALAMPEHRVALFFTVWAGLCASDVWKYWVGRLAHAHAWAARLASKPAVSTLGDTVRNRIGIAMMTARFVPGTRIPLYLAAGWFKVGFVQFLAWMTASAGLYVAVAFAALHALGSIAGPMVVARAGWALAALVVMGLLMVLAVRWWRGRAAV
ncbi:MAG: hypothetical protein MUF14_00630 [Hyphomonadaceae bacterium]|nr:hypothetical protein [Hyphomonadaceae bacterium]